MTTRPARLLVCLLLDRVSFLQNSEARPNKQLVSTTRRNFQQSNTAQAVAKQGLDARRLELLSFRDCAIYRRVATLGRVLATWQETSHGIWGTWSHCHKRGRYTQRWLPLLYIATERNETGGDGSTCIDNALGKRREARRCTSWKAHPLKRIYTRYVIRTR